MKKILIVALMMSAGVLSAQEKHKYEIENEMVKATYYYDNGNIKQEGFYKDGKLHGKWVSYNQDGTKQSIGEYTNGNKSGKWFFWNNATLNEVDYTDSRVAEVKTWSRDAVVLNK